MTKNLKYFLLAFLVSIPFWWGFNVGGENLENFLYWEVLNSPQFFTAQANIEIFQQKLNELKPYRKGEVEDLEIEAKAAVSFWDSGRGKQKILFQKESDKILPIASLTKLMSALVVLKHYDLGEKVEISKKAANQSGNREGVFKVGERFRIGELLYSMLIESNNSAALALAEVIGEDGFVALMNLEAKELGLKNTHFVNPTGLDPERIGDPLNVSNPEDLVNLSQYLLKERPSILDILSLPEYNLYSLDGVFHHKIQSTNELLGEISSIVGGKTGFTYEARECFLLVLKAPKNRGYLINVILGSENRFEEMKKLVNWDRQAYRW